MFWESLISQLKNLGTVWAFFLGVALLALILIKVVEWASIAFVKYVSIPAIRWPRITLPNVAWKQISEPAVEATKMILIIVAVVAFGGAVPLALAFWSAGAANVADPVAYVTAGVLISAVVVSMVGLFSLVRPAGRASVRKFGLLSALACYVIAICWVASIITGFPLALLDN